MTDPIDEVISRRVHGVLAACAALSVGFGVWVLAGWAFDIHVAKSIVPGEITVKPNTALCFMLLGLALWLQVRGGAAARWKRVGAASASLTALVIGFISFLEYLTGWDAGIDQLLFRDVPGEALGSVRPGLMSPITAISFLCLGMALLLLDSKTKLSRGLVHVLCTVSILAALVAILDVMLQPGMHRTHISPLTAPMLLIISFAAMSATPDYGLGALFRSGTSGGAIVRRLLPAAIVVPVLVGWLRWYEERSGLYSEWTGTTFMILSAAVLLSAVAVWTGYVADRTDRSRITAQESNSRLASIVNSSNEAIIGTTVDGVVTSWNPAAQEMYGYGEEEMVGRPLAIIVPPDRTDEFQHILEREKQGERIGHFESERIRKDGQRVQVSIAAAPIKDASGNLTGVAIAARDITEQKRAEEKLREQAALLQLANDAILVCDMQSRVAYWNRGAEKTYGISSTEALGNNVHDLLATRFPVPLETIEAAVRTSGEWTGELIHTCADQRAITVASRWSLMRDQQGNPSAILEINRDISERKRAEQELQKASRYSRALLEASLDPLVTISREGKITDVNAATEKATGVNRPYLIGSDFCDYFTEPEKARRGYQLVFSDGFVHDYPLALRNTSGQIVEVLYNATVFKNDQGEVEGVFAAARDVTERNRAQQALQWSEQRYRSLVTATAQIVWSTDAAGKVVRDMPSWRSYTGMKLEEILGGGWIQALHPDDREHTAEVWAKAVRERALYDTEYRIRRHDGEYRDVAVRGVPVLEADGSLREWIGTCTDITPRKQAQQALEAERQRFRDVLDKLPVYVVLLTPDYHVAMDNTVFRQRFGESQGRRCFEFLFGRDSPCEVCDTYKVLADGSPHQWQWTGPDQREYNIFDFPFTDTDGSPLILEMGLDVTERNRAQAELKQLNQELDERVRRRTEALAAANRELEAFTYSVSHDLRAPLRHISGFSKILSEDFESALPDEAKHLLQRVEEGTRRMGMLVDDLLNLGRIGRHEVRLQVTGLESIANEVITELKAECGERHVEWKIGGLPFVECDPALMKQVFQNLLSNAVKFTRPRADAVIEIGQLQQEGVPVVFVRDNGVGFSMKYADKLFGVFQRLHRAEDFEGTGVGLATVQRIIQKHGGRIWAEAELDRGATFYFFLGSPEKDAASTVQEETTNAFLRN